MDRNKSHLYLSEQGIELQDIYKLNSTNYSEYDNLSSQLRIFLEQIQKNKNISRFINNRFN